MSLQEAFEKTKKELTVTPEKLNEITNHFVSELNKGLSKTGGNIPMIPGWVLSYPTGDETGEYLAIDLGGTNLRVVRVTLLGNSKFTYESEKYAIPGPMRTGKSEDLWNFIADSLDDFVKIQYGSAKLNSKLPLGFTFSYPASQNAINEGILQRWTKGFDIENVEGHDVVPLLQKAIDSKNTPVEVVALINDTTGTLVASKYCDPSTIMGLIFGTGCNGAYYDICKDIPKLEGKLPNDILNDDSPMAINCEYGAFDNEWAVLPRTKYDIQIDNESPRPGQQYYEKMIAGYYLGEVLRLILLDYYSQNLIFKNQDIKPLQVPFAMDTSFPSRIEEHSATFVEKLFLDSFNIKTTEEERNIIHDLCLLIGTRSARLSVCGVAAICKKRNYTSGHCASDGSVFNKYPHFKERAHEALNDIFQWNTDPKDYPITLIHAEDGSGVGAAVIACLTEKRLLANKSVGTIDSKL
ncbi:hexokinase A [Pichia californica]|uniref:Phosphotransferase n=1 Tax=Pichia californica TaxID=460514 RepID=A0A9P6WK68_9ASCO|nr:hexokinase A [[Candida] californica]KAG0688665.1 hexokinase A [[Candida] californica]